jgi:predicted ATPase
VIGSSAHGSRKRAAVIVSGIPRFTPERLTEMRRFISFIDVMYDTKVKLFCSAAAPPFQLMAVDKAAVFDEVSIVFA